MKSIDFKIKGRAEANNQMLTSDKVKVSTPDVSEIPNDRVISVNLSIEAGEAVFAFVKHLEHDGTITESKFIVQNLNLEFDSYKCVNECIIKKNFNGEK